MSIDAATQAKICHGERKGIYLGGVIQFEFKTTQSNQTTQSQIIETRAVK